MITRRGACKYTVNHVLLPEAGAALSTKLGKGEVVVPRNGIKGKLGERKVDREMAKLKPYGDCTGPNCGVFTGVATPTISVRVLFWKFGIQRLPLASIVTAKGSSICASNP